MSQTSGIVSIVLAVTCCVARGQDPLGVDGSPDSEYGSSSSGNSMIVDFRGNVVAQHTDASEWFVMGTIDIEALRKARSQIFMNYIAQLRMEVYANVFQGKTFFPPNAFLEKNKQSQDETWAIQTATVERLRREGILEKPGSM